MSKIRNFIKQIPFRMGVSEAIAGPMSAAMCVIHDYEIANPESEFRRKGDSKEATELRLEPLVVFIDRLKNKFNGDPVIAEEAKTLLMVASTPDQSVQTLFIDESQKSSFLSDLLTVNESKEMGARGFWDLG